MLNELDAFAKIESQNSTFSGRHLRKLYFSGGSHGQGIVNIDSLLVDVTENFPEPDSLAYDPFAEKIPAQYFTGSGMVDFRNMNIPRYRLAGSFEHFPLAKLINNTALPRTVSANFFCAGSGFHPDSLEGKYHFQFKELTFPIGHSCRSKLISISVVTMRQMNELLRFNHLLWPEGLRVNFRSMTSAEKVPLKVNISQTFCSKSSRFDDSPQKRTSSSTHRLARYHHTAHPFNVRFDLNILDLAPVNVLFGKDLSLDVKAKLSGSMTADSKNSTTEISELTIEKSRVNISGTSIVSDKIQTTTSVNIQHSESGSVLQKFQFSTVCDSTLTIDDAFLYRPTIHLNYNLGTMALSASGIYNKQLAGNIVGSLTFQDTVAKFTLDTLIVGFGGGQLAVI